MSVYSMIATKCKQTAVYWGTPTNDGLGRYTFGVVEEVLVRWEDELENFAKDSRTRIQIGKDGKEFRANARIYAVAIPTGGWNVDGYIYLGNLIDLPSDMIPYTIDGAYEIKQINKIPSLNDPSKCLFEIFI
jgi:hypothetical protein